MSQKKFSIFFSGKVAPERNIEEVKRRLISTFKLSNANIERLFSGKKVTVKKNADYQTAIKYKMAFETAGAICKVVEIKNKPVTNRPHKDGEQKTSKSKQPQIVTCPECGLKQETAERCRTCGVIIKKFSKTADTEPEVAEHKISSRTEPLYFAVSKSKLAVMSIFTFGLYEIYWFYKNWKIVKEETGRKIHPFWRAIFAVIYIVLYFSFRYIQYFRPLDLLWLVSCLTFIPLLPVQDLINEIDAKTINEVEQNSQYSWTNKAGIALGAIMWLLMLLVLFLPE